MDLLYASSIGFKQKYGFNNAHLSTFLEKKMET